jgi:fructuronate reductase
MTRLPRLSDATLSALGPAVRRPLYDRAAVTAGIVHLGAGAFHRAHQAVFTDDCLAAGELDWGITAASLRSPDTRDALAPQDGLYSLALPGAVEDLRIVGSIGRVVVAPENPEDLLVAMSAATTRIVSLTVTEKGYGVDASGALRRDDPDIAHDLAHAKSPRTAPGLLVEALSRRRAAGLAPFTVLSCDNLSQNGRVVHGALAAFARARDAGLGDYVAAEVACPSCMVDRIVPATTDADRAAISARLGVRDAWPVVTEPFFQWVIEDHFPLGRPGWERAGVEFSANVADYEAMKLRLLNGAHSTLAAMGRLAGHATVAEAMADPVIRAFVRAYWDEVRPTIAAHIDVSDYTARLLMRFDNVAFHHRLDQIAMDASQKVPPRILGPLRDLRARRAPHGALVLAVAAWMRSCEGVDDSGAPLPMNDPVLAGWTARPTAAMPASEAVRRWLGHAPVFGADLAQDDRLATDLSHALEDLRERGVLAVVSGWLGGR